MNGLQCHSVNLSLDRKINFCLIFVAENRDIKLQEDIIHMDKCIYQKFRPLIYVPLIINAMYWYGCSIFTCIFMFVWLMGAWLCAKNLHWLFHSIFHNKFLKQEPSLSTFPRRRNTFRFSTKTFAKAGKCKKRI